MLKAMMRAALVAALCCAPLSVAAAQEITVRGRLARTVEAGGWVIGAAKQKYLVINASKWKDESWFRAGVMVEATGRVRPDVVTTQMEGTPFEASTLRPAAAATEPEAGDGAAAPQQQAMMPGTTRVVVTGHATARAKPDTALVTVAVVTQAQTALAAQQENARKTDAVVRAVRDAAGAGAEVETSGYNLQPQYVYRQNEAPTIQGYQARNAVNVTLSDLARVGGVIDAATGAGANNVENLSFTLRNDKATRGAALADATRDALAKAQTVAQALGGRVVRVVEVEEMGAQRPVPVYRAVDTMSRVAGAAAPQTPVEIGTLDIHSQVTLVVEITTGQ
ncbi:MAG: SIMPL domain-containing protein [Pyrinomonadaceae bacterium]